MFLTITRPYHITDKPVKQRRKINEFNVTFKGIKGQQSQLAHINI